MSTRGIRSHRFTWLRVAAGLSLLAAVVVAAPSQALAANAGDGPPAAAHMFGAHGANGHGGGGGTRNLVDHGGPVLTGAKLYDIWWGSTSAFPSDATAGLEGFLDGFGGSAYLQVAAQYMHGSSLTTTYGSKFVDTSTPPRRVSTSTLGDEVAKVLKGKPADPNGVYFVYTSNFPSGGGFCAWHGSASVSGTAVAVAYMPNTAGVAGCDPGDLYAANTYSEGTRSLANVTAHELMEALTDAQLSAWYDNAGSEIGDKCAWQFASAVTIGTTPWQLQEEWSNAAGGCVQTN